jgi:hypothetical protein
MAGHFGPLPPDLGHRHPAACGCGQRSRATDVDRGSIARRHEPGRAGLSLPRQAEPNDRPGCLGLATTTPGRGVADADAQLHRLHDAAAVLRAHPDYAAAQARTTAVQALLRSGRFPPLE